MMLMSSLAYSQDLDTLAMDSLSADSLLLDSIKEPPPYYAGIYLIGEAKISPHYNGYNFALSYGAGFQYQKWSIGFTVTEFEGIQEEFVIFPNVFRLDYRYGGPNVGYEIVRDSQMSLDLYASFQLGDMVWERAEPSERVFRDKFSVMSISTQVSFNRVRYIKPYIRVGYQKMNNLILERVNSSDFTGFVFVFGMQIGYFNQ